MTNIYLNNELVELNSVDEETRLAEAVTAKIAKEARKVAAEAHETKKASGRQKLLDLGLSEEEVLAMIGA
jgi:uncharacterized membrane protein